MKNKHQIKLFSFIIKKAHRVGMWCFPQFLLLLMVCAILAVLIACSSESSEKQGSSNPTYGSNESGGDSIFHETMVDMTWAEVEKTAKEGAVILLAIAVIEEHGPHMGCGIDTYLGYITCKIIRRDLESRGIKALIAPPFYWGVNRITHIFPGTFTVRPETMKAVLHDTYASLKSWGFTNIFNIISHGDGLHIVTTLEAIRDAYNTLDINVYCVVSEAEVKRYGLTGKESFIVVNKSRLMDMAPKKYLDIHAGAFETGLVAAYFPDQVDIDLARTLKPTKVTYNDIREWVKDARQVTPLGYVGDPASFDAAGAKKIWESHCKSIADSIENLLKKK